MSSSLEPTPGLGETAPIVKQSPQSEVEGTYAPEQATKRDQYVSTLTQLMTEFVAGGENWFLAALKRSLPTYIDRLTQEFGPDLYDRMMTDSDVYAAIDIRKNQILADGWRLEAPVKPAKPGESTDPERDADAKTAQEMCDFITACVKQLYPRGLLALSYELLDALPHGNKIAEKMLGWAPETGKYKGKLWWTSVKFRDRKKLAWIVDAWFNVVGFFAVEPNKAMLTIPQITIVGDPREYANFLPRDKFIVYSHRPKNENPQGSSLLEAAYAAWIFKTQTLPQWFNNVRRYGEGLLIGETSENVPDLVPQLDPITGQPDNTKPQITREQALMLAMLDAVNGSVLAVGPGTKVDFKTPGSNQGDVFINALNWCEKQIHQAILTTSRASKEAENTSQADNEAAGDVMAQSGNLYKLILGDVWTQDFVLPLIALNWPGQEHLCPEVLFTAVERQDKAGLVTAYAQAGFTIDETQFPGIDDELNLPQRDLAAIAARKAQEQEAQLMQSKMMGGLYAPSQGKPNNLAQQQEAA